jgi:hypothetical protein
LGEKLSLLLGWMGFDPPAEGRFRVEPGQQAHTLVPEFRSGSEFRRIWVQSAHSPQHTRHHPLKPITAHGQIDCQLEVAPA